MVLSQLCADFGDHGEPYHRFSGRLKEHPRVEIFLGVLEAEFLGDRHTVIADEPCAPLLFDQNEHWPSVTRIVLASCAVPARIFSQAAERKRICFCGIGGLRQSGNDHQNGYQRATTSP